MQIRYAIFACSIGAQTRNKKRMISHSRVECCLVRMTLIELSHTVDLYRKNDAAVHVRRCECTGRHLVRYDIEPAIGANQRTHHHCRLLGRNGSRTQMVHYTKYEVQQRTHGFDAGA